MHSKDIKYLGFGLGIGIAVMSLFLGTAFFVPGFRDRILPQEISPTQQTEAVFSLPPIDVQNQQSTNTPEVITATPQANISTPTISTTPTETPPPPASPTASAADALVASGDIAIAGPLTREQQLSLYTASLAFIAPTYAESKKMSVAINNLRFSDPNTTCGPLSLAILQKAGLIGQDIVPHIFFLLNPSLGKDRLLLQTVFSKDRYTNTRYHIRLDKFDWIGNPLMPGDFLYIYGGNDGNFDHMLVVNRVDSHGRVYSVTNYNTEQGFVINEVMLYDPNDPNVGIFDQWTRKPKQILGSTGFSGFEVWRLKQ